MDKPGTIPQKEYNELKSFFEGLNKQAIASELGVTREAVRRIILRLTGKNNPELEVLSDDEIEALEYIRKSLNISVDDIAKYMDAGVKTVRATIYRRKSKNINPNFKWKYYLALSQIIKKKTEKVLNKLEKINV